MKKRNLTLGRHGEELAAAYLDLLGYTLVAQNFTIPIGRNIKDVTVFAEIDLIAYDDATLCFIEVKTRDSDWFATPEVNVDLRKQRQVARAARAYRRLFDIAAAPYRFDVVTVTLSPEGKKNPRIELLKNYWTDSKFRKRKWTDTYINY